MNNLIIGSRVKVEKIIFEDYETPIIMRNAILISENGKNAQISCDDKTTSETHLFLGSGLYSFARYKITAEK